MVDVDSILIVQESPLSNLFDTIHLVNLYPSPTNSRGMNDLVEAALRNARGTTSDETTDEDRASEFEAPSFSLVGCGPAGIARIADDTTFRSGIGFVDTQVELDVTTIALGRPS